MTRLSHAAALVLVVMALGAPEAAAQAVFSGVVLGPDGAPVEGATIYVTNVVTSAQLDFPTPRDGRFEFSGLPAGQYRFTSDIGIMPFTFTLSAGDRVDREVKIPFGPFSSNWTIVPPSPPLQDRGAVPNRPSNCAGFGPPLCGTESMVKEFERDEQERLKRPVLGPRMTRMPVTLEYPQRLIDARREGRVTFAGRIAIDGSLLDLRVVSSDHPDLVDPALASVESARWEPARLRGTPVEVPMTVVVQFLLQPRGPIPGGIAQSLAFAPAQGQAPAPVPAAAPQPATFEVASVKPNNSGVPRVSVQTLPGGRFNAINQTLRGLIRFAYGLQDFQLVGPDWIDTARFDVTASANRMPMPGEIQQMMRVLLADRFKLVMRAETREVPMYELVLAREDQRLGPQLRPADPMGCRQVAPGQPPFGPGLLQGCGTYFGGNGNMTGKSVTMDSLAGNLSGPAGRRVLNRTGLTGLFDAELQFSGGAAGGLGPLPPLPGAPPPPPDERPALTTAVQEQLGLRLNNTRGPIEVQVIESVSQPTRD